MWSSPGGHPWAQCRGCAHNRELLPHPGGHWHPHPPRGAEPGQALQGDGAASRWDKPGTGTVGTPGEGGSSPGRTQLLWCPLHLLSIPPTPLGAQSWCSSSPMGGGHPALPACALGTWHSRAAELRARGAHSAAQGLSALPVSLGATGLSWDSPRASLPEVLEGHNVPRPGDPRPQHGQRSWCWLHQGPPSLGAPLWAVLPSSMATGAGGRPGMSPPLASPPAKGPGCWGHVLAWSCGAWGTHLPLSGTLWPAGTGTGTALCPTGHRDSSVSLLGTASCHCQTQGQLSVHTGHRDNSVPIGHGGSSMSLCQLCGPSGHRGDSVSPVGWGQLEWLCDTKECDTSGRAEPTPPCRGVWLVLGTDGHLGTPESHHGLAHVPTPSPDTGGYK